MPLALQRSTVADADFEKLQCGPTKSRQMTIIDAVIVVPLVSEPTVVTVEDLRHVAAGCRPLQTTISWSATGFPYAHRHFYSLKNRNQAGTLNVNRNQAGNLNINMAHQLIKC